MNNEQIKHFSEILKKRKKDLLDRLKHLDSDRHRNNDPLDQDFSEQAVEAENDEVVDRLHEGVNQELQQINLALERMNNNQYGFCVSCGEAIPTNRLTVVPYASTCVKCAK
jgi:DnaK suppressor protein